MSQKMIPFKTSAGDTFEVEEAVAEQFQAIKDMFDDISAVDAIPLPNITADTFAKVLQYCRGHAEATGKEDLRSFDADFINVDHRMLYDLIQAANYLNIQGLLDLTIQAVADAIRYMTMEELSRYFNM